MDFHAVSGDAADKKVIKFVDQTNNVPANLNVMDFEQQTLGRRGLLKQIPSPLPYDLLQPYDGWRLHCRLL